MLSNAKKGTRVLLENGMKATITAVVSNWSATTYKAKADAGKYRTRSYNAAGKTSSTDAKGGFNISSVIAADAKGNLSAVKKQLAELQETVADSFAAIVDQIAGIEDTAAAPVAAKLTSYDFGDGRGKVAAHRHMNPQGDEGGIVSDDSFVAASARIGRGSLVFGRSMVKGISKIINNARILGGALVDNKTVNGVQMKGTEVSALAACAKAA